MDENTHKRKTNAIFEQNLCVSCGVCNLNKSAKFEFNDLGYLLPNKLNKLDLNSCPVVHENNEDTISRKKFHGKYNFNSQIGYYDVISAASIKDNRLLTQRSSGGIITFVLKSLLKQKKVDAVATVFNFNSEPYFRYKLINNPDDLDYAATSAYYPAEVGTVLAEAKERSLSIAVTGLPCCIKGINHLIDNDTQMQEIIKYQISLICGHLKTSKYLELLSLQLPNIEKAKYNFRAHRKQSVAKIKYFQKYNANEEHSRPTASMYSGSYNYGYFQYESCNYCDDIIGETADLSVGDAWLPEFVDRTTGMSLCVSRNTEISKILNSDCINYRELSPNDVLLAQQGGYRQRREGLAYRIKKYPKYGVKKREHLLPKKIGKKRLKIYEARYQLSKSSHEIYKKSPSVNEFITGMEDKFNNLQLVSRATFIDKLIGKLTREFRKLKVRDK